MVVVKLAFCLRKTRNGKKNILNLIQASNTSFVGGGGPITIMLITHLVNLKVHGHFKTERLLSVEAHDS